MHPDGRESYGAEGALDRRFHSPCPLQTFQPCHSYRTDCLCSTSTARCTPSQVDILAGAEKWPLSWAQLKGGLLLKWGKQGAALFAILAPGQCEIIR